MKELRICRDLLVCVVAYMLCILLFSVILLTVIGPSPNPDCPKGYHVREILGTTVCEKTR